MSRKKIYVLSLAFGLSSLSAHAVPSAYSNNCGPLSIENNTNSTLLRDNLDCRKVWVLPPTSGLSRVSGFTPSGNLNLCSSLKNSQLTIHYLTESLKNQARKAEEIQNNLAQEENKLIDLESKLIEYEKLPEVLQIKQFTSDLEDLESKIEKLNDKITEVDSKKEREEIKAERNQLKVERNNLKEEIRNLSLNYRKEARKHAELESEVKAQEKKVQLISDRFDKSASVRMELQEKVTGYMKHFASLEGGYAHLDYNTGWEENLKELNRQYSSQFDFVAIQTKNAKVYSNFVSAIGDTKENYMSTLPLIISYTFGGLRYSPIGEDKIGEYSSLPSHLSGSVRLSLIGACPFYYDNFLNSAESVDLKESTNLSKKNMDFSVMVNYEYPAAYKFKVTASYNLYKFYEKIVSTTTKGGFFSSKTARDISENSIDKDSFNINWEDEESNYSHEEKREIEKNLKEDLIARVLHNMAIPVSPAPLNTTPTSLERFSHGAVVLARGITDTCGSFSIFCRGSSWFVAGLDSVFGGNSARESYRSTQDRTASETWSTSETRWIPATTGFYKK